MKLSQILINSGVTPEDLHPECKFIAQDGDDEYRVLSQYSDIPDLSKDKSWFSGGSYLCEDLPDVIDLASDWRTPLSREQFTADYAAHVAAKLGKEQ